MRNQELVREFIVNEYMPGVRAEQLRLDYDLIASGTIDSLSLLKILAWLQDQFGIPIDDVEITQDNFTSVEAICHFVELADKEEK